MNEREQRGLVIAALCKLNNQGETWLVPSQSTRGAERTYTVNVKAQTCTCPDHTEGGHKCKHIYACEITLKREYNPDGTVTDTRSVTFTEQKTYKQDWPAYNAAQRVEKDRFQELLADLCRDLPDIDRAGKTGRKPHKASDAVFAMVFKVYVGFSGRRFTCDLQEAHRRGHISVPMSGEVTWAAMEGPHFTPVLKQLIARSALPLRVVETRFAIDSSGFGTSRFETWYDQKYGVTRRKSVWVKAHVASGVRTNVVTAIRILDKDAADSPQFAPLVKDTAKGFEIGEVSADKAYLSLENFETVAGFGGAAFIPFKENSTGAKGGLFEKMYHYFNFQREEFDKHYHQRSNVESTFSMMKRKFGDSVRSKSDVAMVNEVLCKVLAHNICCLIQEQHELGIEPVFWPNDPPMPPALTDGAAARQYNRLQEN